MYTDGSTNINIYNLQIVDYNREPYIQSSNKSGKRHKKNIYSFSVYSVKQGLFIYPIEFTCNYYLKYILCAYERFSKHGEI